MRSIAQHTQQQLVPGRPQSETRRSRAIPGKRVRALVQILELRHEMEQHSRSDSVAYGRVRGMNLHPHLTVPFSPFPIAPINSSSLATNDGFCVAPAGTRDPRERAPYTTRDIPDVPVVFSDIYAGEVQHTVCMGMFASGCGLHHT